MTAQTLGAGTRMTLHTMAGVSPAVLVRRDSTVAPDADPTRIAVLGTTRGDSVTTVILTDTYPSIPGSLGRCGAGEEQFVRAVALTATGARETYRRKVASCRDDLALADTGLAWERGSATLRVRWLVGADAPDRVAVVRFGRDGQPRAGHRP